MPSSFRFSRRARSYSSSNLPLCVAVLEEAWKRKAPIKLGE